jgi:alkylhydroperoxidase family enzyme
VGIDWGTASTAEVIGAVLREQPDVAAHLAAAHDEAWNTIDPVLLELVRLRVAMLLDNAAERAVRTPAAVAAGFDEALAAELPRWPTSPLFGPRERACLDLTEQWVIDVASVSDAQTQAVTDVLGPEGLAGFAAALLVIEQRQRLRLAWTRLFAPEEVS